MLYMYIYMYYINKPFQNVSDKTKSDSLFSVPLTYQKIPSRNELVLSAANSFKSLN